MTGADRPSPLFAALTGLVSLGVLAQGALAGVFVGRPHASAALTAHRDLGMVVTALAVGTAGYAVVQRRRLGRGLAGGAVLLAGLLLVQLATGSGATSAAAGGTAAAVLLAVHLPIALLAFGLTGWLSVQARRVRVARGGAGKGMGNPAPN